MNVQWNNLVVKNQTGVTQGGVAGTIDVLRFKYTYSASITADYTIGDNALFASHTSAVNDGKLPIKDINQGGNNLVIYNPSGATQGGVAGNVNSYQWIYALPTDPSSQVSVGYNVTSKNATNLLNNGTFPVRQVNRSATSNVVLYNENGVTQAGAVGTVFTARKLIKFDSDQSSIYATNSRVLIKNTADRNNEGVFDVVQVNRGGGANYNIVIEEDSMLEQPSPCGHIEYESRSIFSTRPSIDYSRYTYLVSTNGVLDTTEKVVAAGRILAVDILQIQGGSPQNLTITVS